MRINSTVAMAAAIASAVTFAAPAQARYWHHHGGFGAALGGFAAGALLGGALASRPYYGNGYYVAPGYYDYGYDDGYAYEPPVVVGTDPSAVAYCEKRFRSYDPASGTYLGYDGNRHPCP